MDRNAFPQGVCTTGCEQKASGHGQTPFVAANFKRPMERPLLFRRLPRWAACSPASPCWPPWALRGWPGNAETPGKPGLWRPSMPNFKGVAGRGHRASSWWHGFPDISVDLTQVLAISTEGDTLLRADRVGLELDLWSVLGDTPEVGSIHVVQGQIDLPQDAQGHWNFSPFGPIPPHRSRPP